MEKNVSGNKAFLGACTMVYGHYVNNWLLQFIHYYINVIGVEIFYIYDDAGRRPTKTEELLQKLIDDFTGFCKECSHTHGTKFKEK